jgi:hypothetical protein
MNRIRRICRALTGLPRRAAALAASAAAAPAVAATAPPLPPGWNHRPPMPLEYIIRAGGQGPRPHHRHCWHARLADRPDRCRGGAAGRRASGVRRPGTAARRRQMAGAASPVPQPYRRRPTACPKDPPRRSGRTSRPRRRRGHVYSKDRCPETFQAGGRPRRAGAHGRGPRPRGTGELDQLDQDRSPGPTEAGPDRSVREPRPSGKQPHRR